MLYLCINKNDKVMTRNYYVRFFDSSASVEVSHDFYRKALHNSLLNGFFVKQVFHRFGATLYLDMTRFLYLKIY